MVTGTTTLRNSVTNVKEIVEEAESQQNKMQSFRSMVPSASIMITKHPQTPSKGHLHRNSQGD